MSSKHTPGPWTYTGRFVSAHDDRIIADCSGECRMLFETQEANARLIAAAPELLEALKDAVKCIPDKLDSFKYKNVIEAALKAIARAEGRE